jgi:hypothetical protein
LHVTKCRTDPYAKKDKKEADRSVKRNRDRKNKIKRRVEEKSGRHKE